MPQSVEYPTVEYSADRSQLRLKVTEPESARLRQIREEEPDWGASDLEADYLEPLICNSELMWLDPSDTGDLTDAPLLGILGDECHKSSGPHGVIHVGRDSSGTLYCPILERWGYEPYQVRSFMDDLADKGVAIFINQW